MALDSRLAASASILLQPQTKDTPWSSPAGKTRPQLQLRFQLPLLLKKTRPTLKTSNTFAKSKGSLSFFIFFL
ncbi:hypothetical protein TorRG33x02_018290 [Trema orientale]|uniref:Uncharacterized protein n=1 Tax=Trema orientale TaxID=63057 RepID=A0A2P5FW95_TREOI|nr:hypothetical protein TorRG33x02_018290 [Trema orientale]